MKKRIKIDSAILSFFIILTGLLYMFPHWYSTSLALDHILSFFGFVFIFKGICWRMIARGYKKAHSSKGQGLVTSGPYEYVRNPMYLGSFLLGCGFILLVWPWWTLPIYAGLFFLRFQKQIVKEEAYLAENFGDEFIRYCRRVPRLFPNIRKFKLKKIKKDFPWQQAWSTKERIGLFAWPLAGLLMELAQKKFIFGSSYWQVTLCVFFCAVVLLGIKMWLIYKKF